MINKIEFLFNQKRNALFSLSLSFTVNYFKDIYRAFRVILDTGMGGGGVLLSHCH